MSWAKVKWIITSIDLSLDPVTGDYAWNPAWSIDPEGKAEFLIVSLFQFEQSFFEEEPGASV